MASPPRKYARELAKHLPAGYTIAFHSVPGGTSREGARRPGHHPCVIKPDGSVLRDDRGMPVRVCGSPGSTSSLKYDIARIRRALKAAGAD